jgi:hypothetical protein
MTQLYVGSNIKTSKRNTAGQHQLDRTASEYGPALVSHKHSKEPSASVKQITFLYQLSNNYCVREQPVLWRADVKCISTYMQCITDSTGLAMQLREFWYFLLLSSGKSLSFCLWFKKTLQSPFYLQGMMAHLV